MSEPPTSPLLRSHGYAFTLNLAIWVGAKMERMVAAAGVDVPAAQSNDAWMLPIPATFIVGRDGVIPRMGIEDMLAALRRAP